MFDTLIQNARIVDGTMAPWFKGDLAIEGDKIAVIGNLQHKKARRVIDAEGLVLCPGFIEIHGHSDATLLINRLAESSVHQGVTTECIGNCGDSIFPVNSKNHDRVKNHFTSFLPDYDVRWSTLTQLKAVYEDPGIAVNVVPLVGHNTIRAAVKGYSMEPANPQEITEMVSLISQAMVEGAVGFSTGLEYPTGSAADTRELIDLVKPVAEYGGLYATHIRNRDLKYLEAVNEAIEIGQRTGASVQISHNVAKIGAPEGIMPKVLEAIEDARRLGLDIAFDVGAYLGGQTTPLASLPPWAFEGGPQETLRRLADPECRQKMKAYEYPIWRIIKLNMWGNVRLAVSSKNSHLVGKTFEEIAQEQNKDPYDVLFDLLLDEGIGFFDLMWEGEIYKPEDRDMVLKHRLASVCCDGRTLAPYGPLSKRNYHHAYSWISYLLRHHVRERQFLTLEEAIHKVTAASAARLGLVDRGVIKSGLAADLVIFDPDTITDRTTLQKPDLYPDGINYVFVNGQLTIERNTHTGTLSGKVLLRSGH
ncbi:MAG: amidohydrolase family protein [Proteobacteria bacterium]|nr:amidohydrolase family protein [Pseudomonadota bacterium]